MRPSIFAALVVLVIATPVAATLVQQIPPADQWQNDPTLAPAVRDPQMRAEMNAEIVRAIRAANGNQATARAAIQEIAARYEASARRRMTAPARVVPGPGTRPPTR